MQKIELEILEKKKNHLKTSFLGLQVNSYALPSGLIVNVFSGDCVFPTFSPSLSFITFLLMGLKIPVLLQIFFHLGVAHLHLCLVLNA